MMQKSQLYRERRIVYTHIMIIFKVVGTRKLLVILLIQKLHSQGNAACYR